MYKLRSEHCAFLISLLAVVPFSKYVFYDLSCTVREAFTRVCECV